MNPVNDACAETQKTANRLQSVRLCVNVFAALVNLARLLHDWCS